MSSPDLIEVALSDLDDDAAAAVAEIFDRRGWGGTVHEEILDEHGGMHTTLKTYVAASEEERLRQIEIDLALLNRQRAAQGRPAIPLPQLRHLAETDWAEAWKAHYHVLPIGRRLVIKPTWEPYTPRPDQVVIELDPGLAFGSGLHATTRLCLELLEEHLRPGGRVLDVGTGSGILAIAAARLGAAAVLALDNDPEAVRVARENVALNGVADRVTVRAGTLAADGTLLAAADDAAPGLTAELPPHLGERGDAPMTAADNGHPPGDYDLVLANILAETIVELAPGLVRSLAAAGKLVVSGIIQERADAVVERLRACSLPRIERHQDGDWVALLAQR